MENQNLTLPAMADLGLLTRVACHEMNNLLASQQGFLRMIARADADDPSRTRWLEQVAAVSRELAALVLELQRDAHAMHAGQRDAVAAGVDWTADQTSLALANALRREGCSAPVLILHRIVTLVAELAGQDVQSLAAEASLHASAAGLRGGSALFGHLGEFGSALWLHVPDRLEGRAVPALLASAEQILPPPGGNPTEWKCALLATLLRQQGGDLLLVPATESAPALYCVAMPRHQ